MIEKCISEDFIKAEEIEELLFNHRRVLFPPYDEEHAERICSLHAQAVPFLAFSGGFFRLFRYGNGLMVGQTVSKTKGAPTYAKGAGIALSIARELPLYGATFSHNKAHEKVRRKVLFRAKYLFLDRGIKDEGPNLSLPPFSAAGRGVSASETLGHLSVSVERGFSLYDLERIISALPRRRYLLLGAREEEALEVAKAFLPYETVGEYAEIYYEADKEKLERIGRGRKGVSYWVVRGKERIEGKGLRAERKKDGFVVYDYHNNGIFLPDVHLLWSKLPVLGRGKTVEGGGSPPPLLEG